MEQPHVDSRFRLIINVKNEKGRPVNLSTATVTFRLRSPSQIVTDVTPVKSNGGADGVLHYFTALPEAGRWDVQVLWSDGGSSYKSHVMQFGVLKNL